MNNRRDFLQNALIGGAALATGSLCSPWSLRADEPAGEKKAGDPPSKMGFGLVTYMWGFDWDLPTLIKNCETSGMQGVELRTEHAHGVEPSLSAAERKEVHKRFEDTSVRLVGLGANWAFHDPDPKKLAANIDGAKAFIRLSHDVGGSGVKVKPNDLPKGVRVEKTTEQIGKSLNELGEYAAGFGQEIRLEVHGQCQELPTIKKIMDVADNKSVGVCWNSNGADLHGDGLEANFNLVKDRFGATCHVRELEDKSYPYAQLMKLFKQIDYAGWILMEARGKQKDRVAALKEQRMLFEKMTKG